MTRDDLYIFIIWPNGINSEEELLLQISNNHNLIIKKVIEFNTIKTHMPFFFIEFYRINSYIAYKKAKEVGSGFSKIIFVHDLKPRFQFRLTNSGKRMVNINIFDIKILMRNIDVSNSIHATNDIRETDANIEVFNAYSDEQIDTNDFLLTQDKLNLSRLKTPFLVRLLFAIKYTPFEIYYDFLRPFMKKIYHLTMRILILFVKKTYFTPFFNSKLMELLGTYHVIETLNVPRFNCGSFDSQEYNLVLLVEDIRKDKYILKVLSSASIIANILNISSSLLKQHIQIMNYSGTVGNSYFYTQDYLGQYNLKQFILTKSFDHYGARMLSLFFLNLLPILKSLRIIHRDIRPENIIVKTGEFLAFQLVDWDHSIQLESFNNSLDEYETEFLMELGDWYKGSGVIFDDAFSAFNLINEVYPRFKIDCYEQWEKLNDMIGTFYINYANNELVCLDY